jgi:hypothetical protein
MLATGLGLGAAAIRAQYEAQNDERLKGYL